MGWAWRWTKTDIVEEVWIEDQRRYVVCLKIRPPRIASTAKPWSPPCRKLWFSIDEDKIKEHVRYDGKWVLTTKTDLPASEVVLKYRSPPMSSIISSGKVCEAGKSNPLASGRST